MACFSNSSSAVDLLAPGAPSARRAWAAESRPSWAPRRPARRRPASPPCCWSPAVPLSRPGGGGPQEHGRLDHRPPQRPALPPHRRKSRGRLRPLGPSLCDIKAAFAALIKARPRRRNMQDLLRITVAIPCYNEAPDHRQGRRRLPGAAARGGDPGRATTPPPTTAPERGRRPRARASCGRSGAGKGFVMQTILETVDSDVCVVVDGDDTYFAEDVHTLLAPVLADRADMVVGDRLQQALARGAQRPAPLRQPRDPAPSSTSPSARRFRDVLSGYRVMNRNFMRSVPLITGGFETETELTLQALEKGMVDPGAAHPLPRAARRAASRSCRRSPTATGSSSPWPCCCATTGRCTSSA